MLRNKLQIGLLFIGIGFGQTVMNSLGLGTRVLDSGSASMGNGSNVITPSFTKDVSLGNPATWKNLDFTYIHTGYGGGQVSFSGGGLTGASGLNRAQFIVPIKGKNAFGITLQPYMARKAELGSTSTSFTTEGGLNALTPSVGIQLTENESIGISYSLLFGSSRFIKSMTLDSVLYGQSNRISHSGSNLDVYIASDRLTLTNKTLFLFGHIGFPVTPVDATMLKYQMFEDNDGSGHHNTSSTTAEADFPVPSTVSPPDTIELERAMAPFELGAGTDVALSERLHVTSEFRMMDYNYSSRLVQSTPLNDAINQSLHFQAGLTHYNRNIVRNAGDRFTWRTGIFSNRYSLKNSSNSIMENGISVGFGFIFGLTKNQLDLSYQFGMRSGIPGVSKEMFSNVAVSMSLSDIWFVKRREL